MVTARRPDTAFWSGRTVLLTGHTGFKGAWLARMLRQLGSRVVGLSLPPSTEPALFTMLLPDKQVDHHLGDIRDAERVRAVIRSARPSVVFHLAAQALVPAGYDDPAGTFATNVDGSIHIMEAMRGCSNIEAAVLVTTDKVYHNDNTGLRFREADRLGGKDPYSASKAAAEVAVACWRESFGAQMPPMATARAGNVIGGGDFAPTRLVPDIVRALVQGESLVLRYPDATRPWQHVLDVLVGYLLLAEQTAATRGSIPAMNFAPDAPADIRVRDVIAAFEQAFQSRLPWTQAVDPPPEAATLALDPRLAMETLRWRPRLDHQQMIESTAAWYAAWRRGDDMARRCEADVADALA